MKAHMRGLRNSPETQGRFCSLLSTGTFSIRRKRKWGNPCASFNTYEILRVLEESHLYASVNDTPLQLGMTLGAHPWGLPCLSRPGKSLSLLYYSSKPSV